LIAYQIIQSTKLKTQVDIECTVKKSVIYYFTYVTCLQFAGKWQDEQMIPENIK
jgi:hypothetical protein